MTFTAAALCLPSLAQTQGAATSSVPSVSTKITNTAANTVAPKRPAPANAVAAKQISLVGKGTQKVTTSSKRTKGNKKVPEPPAQLPPPPPPPPPTPAQLPPNPARVTMRNGLLTIDANNSTLADVLTGVRRETKAAIDLPAGASGERVVANLGPGTPQTVLTALLNGSRFDYIILGSQDQPDTVQRVILRAKSGSEPAPAAVANAQRPPNSNVQLPPPEESVEGTQAGEAPDENNPQPQQQEIDGETQPEQQQQGQAGQQQQQQQPGVKTPEQLLEELRQMQQQQQEQQNQQQNPQQPQPQYQQQQPQQPAPDEQ